MKLIDIRSKIKTGAPGLRIQNLTPFLGLAFVVILFAFLTGGLSLRVSNIQRILLQSILLIIGGAGVSFTIAHGHLDFAIGGILGMSVVLGGIAGSINPLLTIPVVIAAAVVGELIVVSTSIFLAIPSFIVSLAMMFITKGVLVGITQTRSVELSSIYYSWDSQALYFIVLFIVLIAAVFLMEYTKIGKFNKAIGANHTAAMTTGIPVDKYKIIAFVVAGTAVGISAFLNFVRAGGVSATTGSGYEINVLISLVLGGTSLTGGTGVKIRGAVVGCLILVVLENGLVILGVQPAMMGLIKGLLFLTAIALAYDRKSGQLVT